MEGVKLRVATLDDKDDVIGIRDDIYDGRDYLVNRYEEFLTCPRTTAHVALMDGKIVAFVAMLLIDDGLTMVTRAGRSSLAVAGQGVYKALNSHVTLEAEKCGALVSAFTTANSNQAIYTKSFRMKYKEILVKSFVRFLVDIASVPEPCEDDSAIVHEPDDKEIESYFSNKDTRAYLFPNNRLVCSWVPYKLLHSNLSHVRRPHINKHVISDVTVDAGGNTRGLFSISSTFQCNDMSYFTDMDIHGTDAKSLKRHVLSHFRFNRHISKGIVSLLVFFEPEFDREELNKAFAEVGLEESVWYYKDGVAYTDLFLFEKNLQCM